MCKAKSDTFLLNNPPIEALEQICLLMIVNRDDEKRNRVLKEEKVHPTENRDDVASTGCW